MSEDSEPVATVETGDAPQLSHRRILWMMAIVLIVGVALSLIYAQRNFTLGLIIGGALAFLNYYWLKLSLKNIFDRMAASGEKPRFLAMQYFLRYAALGAGVAVVYITKIASLPAVLLGLSIIAPAVVVEGIIRIFTSNSSKREEL
ncbi:MAG TPA: ATP synthase subunit I [Pyrinomonadaceae bacterium]|jgi:L-asparagine transporter-like permease